MIPSSPKTQKEEALFVKGAIAPAFVAAAIAAHQSKVGIGAHAIFLGQVRADQVGEAQVSAIEYSAYVPMAMGRYSAIREAAFARFDLSCMHVRHSLGWAKVGEISFFVFVSSPHRIASFEAVRFVVDEIKDALPIFGKEIFNGGHQWKVNR